MGFYGKIYNEIKRAFNKIKIQSNNNEIVEIDSGFSDEAIILKAGQGINLTGNSDTKEILIDSTILNPLKFKGSVDQEQFNSLSNPIEGDMYKISTSDWRLNDMLVKVGDTIIYTNNNWIVIPSGDDIEDTWREIYINNNKILDKGNSGKALEFKDGTEEGTFLINDYEIKIPISNSRTNNYLSILFNSYNSHSSDAGDVNIKIMRNNEIYKEIVGNTLNKNPQLVIIPMGMHEITQHISLILTNITAEAPVYIRIDNNEIVQYSSDTTINLYSDGEEIPQSITVEMSRGDIQ